MAMTPDIRNLTRRQWDVANLVAKGLPNKDIARELGLANGTVRVHLNAIFRTLGIKNRTQLALLVNAGRA